MPPEISFGEHIDTALAMLKSAPIAQLRANWRVVFNTEPPSAFGPDLLRRSLAQHRQEQDYGGLSKRARSELERTIHTLKQDHRAGSKLRVELKLARSWFDIGEDKLFA